MKCEDPNAIGDYIERCAILASLIEVSSFPKPGNVHRLRNYEKTRFEHFLVGAVVSGAPLRRLAIRGFRVATGELSFSRLAIGECILEAIRDTLSWQKGGNVNLGTLLLLAPLAASAGFVLAKYQKITAQNLRRTVRTVVQNTTPEDAVHVYKAIRLASPGGLGRVEDLDVMEDTSLRKILEKRITLYSIFKKYSYRDSICKEWATGFSITFTIGYPSLKCFLREIGDINKAVVMTFLKILSSEPDTLIIRKSGYGKAKWVSETAKEILKRGGILTDEGIKLLWEFDEKLHSARGKLNPGTTADLTAASLFVLFLEGVRF
ncbi:MAG: triphosphoribosyl-dephospho-CoA synthase [Candidatus Baldrarchaeia archaeon]